MLATKRPAAGGDPAPKERTSQYTNFHFWQLLAMQLRLPQTLTPDLLKLLSPHPTITPRRPHRSSPVLSPRTHYWHTLPTTTTTTHTQGSSVRPRTPISAIQANGEASLTLRSDGDTCCRQSSAPIANRPLIRPGPKFTWGEAK
jgi:hypothetical protein